MNKKIMVWFFYAILIFLLVAGAVLIFPMQRRLSEDAKELNRQRLIEEQKRVESGKLNFEVNALQNSQEAVEKVAREKFNLCKEGETVMEYETPKSIKK